MTSDMNSTILECIDAGLDPLGGTGKKAVYWYLSQKCNVERENIPEQPSSLVEALKTMFGQGAGVLERTITRELKQRFSITLGEDLGEVLSMIRQASRFSSMKPSSRR